MNETERRIRALELAIEAARNGARSCSILDDAKAFLEFISDADRDAKTEIGIPVDMSMSPYDARYPAWPHR